MGSKLLYKSERIAPSLSRCMPFLFEPVQDDPKTGGPDDRTRRFIVKVALWDMSYQDMRWAGCGVVGEYPLVPSVDLVLELWEFDSELEALEFMREWWVNHQV